MGVIIAGLVSIIIAGIIGGLVSFLCYFMYLGFPFELDWGLEDVKPLEVSTVSYNPRNKEQPVASLVKHVSSSHNGNEFRVLIFTDLHLASGYKHIELDNIAIKYIKRNIEDLKPDLIVITGDLITYIIGSTRAHRLAQLMEKYQVWWAPILGNHDFERGSRRDVVDIWRQYPHCLVDNVENLTGYTNYALDLFVEPDENTKPVLVKRLILLDSHNYLSQEEADSLGLIRMSEMYYAYIKKDQVDWYERTALEAKNLGVKSLLFFHIPLPEFRDAYKDGKVLYGQALEGICSSHIQSGLFDAVQRVGTTEAMFCGHDHVNDFISLYKNVLFVYVQYSGYAEYDVMNRACNPYRRQGCTLVTITQDPSDTIKIQPYLNTRFSDYVEHDLTGRNKANDHLVQSYHGDHHPIKL